MKRFLKDTSGNIALMFGVCSMMLVIGVGAALDHTALASQAKTLQDYTDAAVLAAATSDSKDLADLTVVVNDTLTMHNQNGWTIQAVVSIDADDVITVNTSTIYDTLIMGAVGHGDIPINVSASAPHGDAAPLNIALVLDSTFSMKDGNLDDLKTATTGTGGFIDILEDMNNEKIRMSVIPFSEYVNVGVSNRNAAWMNVEADDTIYGPEVCSMVTPTETTCTGTQENTSSRDGIEYTYTSNTGCTTSNTGAPPYQNCYDPTLYSQKWYGCAGSRLAPKNTDSGVNGMGNRVPGIMYISGSAGYPVPVGHHNPSCGSEMLPLTESYSDVRSKINGMVPNGLTYIPTGLMWGWRTLTPDAPFEAGSAAATDPNEPTINALVLMSDGANTVRKEDVYHIVDSDSDSVAGVGVEANALTATMCDAIKNDDIIVYTVAYNFPSDPAGTKAILQSCATSPTNYFDANNAAELNAAFKQIGQQIFSVRILR